MITRNKKPTPPSLGTSVEAVLKAWREHPGELDMKPFAFDVHTGFDVFIDEQGQLHRKMPGTCYPLSFDEKQEFIFNLAAGAVDIYLQRPSAGIRDDLVRPKKVIHRATLNPIPMQ